jgi:hypothetical protein
MIRIAIVALVLTGWSVSVQAGPIVYPNAGTAAPSTIFTAVATGPVTAYFYATDAGYDSQIGLLINGVSTGILGLPNHSSSYGDSLFLGNASAGDLLEFRLYVNTTNESWYSNPAHNSDGMNHVYSVAYTPSVNDLIPAGIYIGFEDLPYGGDLDYNDHQFVFTNVGDIVTNQSIATPEPSAIVVWTVVAGVFGVGGLRRKSKRVAEAA